MNTYIIILEVLSLWLRNSHKSIRFFYGGIPALTFHYCYRSLAGHKLDMYVVYCFGNLQIDNYACRGVPFNTSLKNSKNRDESQRIQATWIMLGGCIRRPTCDLTSKVWLTQAICQMVFFWGISQVRIPHNIPEFVEKDIKYLHQFVSWWRGFRLPSCSPSLQPRLRVCQPNPSDPCHLGW